MPIVTCNLFFYYDDRFKDILNFLVDGINNFASSIKMINVFGSINHTTVKKYSAYFIEAFLFYNIERFDLKG